MDEEIKKRLPQSYWLILKGYEEYLQHQQQEQMGKSDSNNGESDGK